jgi:hypothetical protein
MHKSRNTTQQVNSLGWRNATHTRLPLHPAWGVDSSHGDLPEHQATNKTLQIQSDG